MYKKRRQAKKQINQRESEKQYWGTDAWERELETKERNSPLLILNKYKIEYVLKNEMKLISSPPLAVDKPCPHGLHRT